ncbi:unnamed protein product [Peronospora belbahrii]|uniref:DUF1249 domain-containing protein n=1 Tax=Peronospora belbahrii TaxID=622444 RepID=A0ABN8CUJ4_9STRA|nr:unnamed protein product [Peronospora belbahrii]
MATLSRNGLKLFLKKQLIFCDENKIRPIEINTSRPLDYRRGYVRRVLRKEEQVVYAPTFREETLFLSWLHANFVILRSMTLPIDDR